MIGPIIRPWGKMRRDGDVLAWHPLDHHCLDVAAVFRALVTRTALGRRLAAVAGMDSLSEVQVWRLTWLAYLHDVGKLNAGFQAQAHVQAHTGAGGARRVGHVGPVRGLFHRSIRTRAKPALRWQALECWAGDQARAYFCAAVAHHGKPHTDLTDRSDDDRLWRPTGGHDPLAALEAFADVGAAALAPAFSDAPDLLPPQPEVSRAVAGLIMLADWVASDDAEGFFPHSTMPDADRFAWATERAATVLAAMGLDVSRSRTRAAERSAPLAFLGADTPRPLQSHLAALPVEDGYSAVVLESDTGSGKTEAALAHFLRLFAAGQVDGLFFALPTRAAAVQIHGRVRDAIRAALGDAAPPVVLAVPGYLRVDDADGQRPLTGFQALWPDTVAEADRPRVWAAEHPKRFLAAPVAVGTLDQALLSVLQVPHAHMRAAALGRLLVVVDEVHASDPYMTALLRQILTRLRAARGHVLLMSATLGAAARAPLLFQAETPPHAAAAAAPYPLVTVAVQGRPPHAQPCAHHDPVPRRVRVDALPLIDDAPAVAAQALEAAQAGARVLVLRNTVSAAIATQQALEAAAPNSRLLFRCADSPLAYPDLRVLEATWRLIEARDGWTLPAMNRELVEGATHPEVLAALATDLGDAWAGHAARMDGLRYAQQAVAALGCINTAEPYCAAGFPEGETIATRLGARDRSVAFADPPPSLFAPHIPLDTLTIPHWMAQGIPEDAQPILRAIPPAGPPTGPPGTLTSSGPTVRFALGERGYIYDRLGLRPETE